jgi:hypothetical protein
MSIATLRSLCRAALSSWSLFVSVASVVAQSRDSEPFNWAYSAAFGSGVYQLGDGTEAQTYRGNFSIGLGDSEDERARVRLLLPATIGLQNLDDDDLPVDRPSDRLEHVTFLPGVELEHEPGRRWTLRTRAQLGIGKELEGTQGSARVAAVGLRSRVRFADALGSPALINGLLWSGFDPEIGARGSLLRFTTAIELDFRAARWRVRDRPMRWRPHVLKDWYYHPPPALAYDDGDVERVKEEWQIGVAAVREGGFKIRFIEFEGVGIAYRFSDVSSGLKLYISSVF